MTQSPARYAVAPLLVLFAIALAGCVGGGSGLTALTAAAPVVAPSEVNAQPQERAQPQEPQQISGPQKPPEVKFNDYFAVGETGNKIVVIQEKPEEKNPEFALQGEPEETKRQTAWLTHYCRPDGTYSVQGKIVFENSDATDWGVWVRKDPYGADRKAIFGAEFDTASTSAAISGSETGSRPAGNISYEGRVVGRHNSGQSFIGTVELEFEGGAINEMSVTFSRFIFGEFGNDHEIARNNIAVTSGGSFSHSSGREVLSGNFYGDNHAGVGGSLKSPDENIGLAAFGGMKKP